MIVSTDLEGLRGDHSFYLDRQITHLIHLAMGYAHNLGLTRVPATFMEGRPGVLDAADAEEAMYTRDPRTLQALEKIHNLEEQRTYLGCYYLMSVYVSAPDHVEEPPR